MGIEPTIGRGLLITRGYDAETTPRLGKISHDSNPTENIG
jgi:hypothetical protein